MKALLLISMLASVGAMAQTTTTINQSEADVTPSILEKIIPDRISHFSIVTGPSVDGNSDPRNSDGTINTDGTSSWHQVSFGYNITDKTRFVINPRFTISRSEDNPEAAEGEMADHVVGITTTWFEYGNLTFSGGLNSIVTPITETSRERGLEWNPGGFQSLNYKVDDKLNVGTWLWGRYAYYSKDPERARAPLFVSPYLSYSLADKLTFQTFYQVNGQLAEVDTLQWDPDEHFNVSVIYSVNKVITLQPIITVFRETNFDVQEGNFNLWVSGRFF